MREALVMLPTRVYLSLAAVGILLAVGGWLMLVTARLPLDLPKRVVLALLISIMVLTTAAWIIFVLPAYWD